MCKSTITQFSILKIYASPRPQTTRAIHDGVPPKCICISQVQAGVHKPTGMRVAIKTVPWAWSCQSGLRGGGKLKWRVRFEFDLLNEKNMILLILLAFIFFFGKKRFEGHLFSKVLQLFLLFSACWKFSPLKFLKPTSGTRWRWTTKKNVNRCWKRSKDWCSSGFPVFHRMEEKMGETGKYQSMKFHRGVISWEWVNILQFWRSCKMQFSCKIHAASGKHVENNCKSVPILGLKNIK